MGYRNRTHKCLPWVTIGGRPYFFARLVVVVLSILMVASPGQAQENGYTETIQLGPDLGYSLGLIDPPPQDGSPAATTSLLPFGNYVSPSAGSSVYARSYLYFPVQLLQPPSTLSVVSATLQVYIDSWPFEGSAAIGVYNVTGAWDETMTWGTRIALEETPVSVIIVSSSAGWYTWDVTNLALSWQRFQDRAPNNGLVLAAVPPQDSGSITPPGWAGRGLGRTGADPALAPRLVIAYSPTLVTLTPTFTPSPTPLPTQTPVPLPTDAPSPPQAAPPTPSATPQPTLTVTPLPTPMTLPQTGRDQTSWLLPRLGLTAGLIGLWAVLRKGLLNRMASSFH